MRTKLFLSAATVLACSLLPAQAGDKEEITAAIKKLAEKANYSWTSTSKRPESTGDSDQRRRGSSGPTTGKMADGVTHLSSTRGDRTSESLIKGSKVATKRDGAWAAVEARGDDDGQGRRRGRGGRDLRDYKAPAARAEELLGKVASLKKDGDAYTGELSAEDAKAMLTFGGGRRGGGGDAAARPEPTGLKVTAKFWVKDGVLAKYETVTAGSISFNGNERDLARTTTTEIQDVGTTKVEIPEEASKLLAE